MPLKFDIQNKVMAVQIKGHFQYNYTCRWGESAYDQNGAHLIELFLSFRQLKLDQQNKSYER